MAGIHRTAGAQVGRRQATDRADRIAGMQPPPWTEHAHCRGMDPSIFFPSDGIGVQEAVAVCAGCPVRDACLDYALENRIQHGVFGGHSERSRDRLLRERRRAARTSVDSER